MTVLYESRIIRIEGDKQLESFAVAVDCARERSFRRAEHCAVHVNIVGELEGTTLE